MLGGGSTRSHPAPLIVLPLDQSFLVRLGLDKSDHSHLDHVGQVADIGGGNFKHVFCEPLRYVHIPQICANSLEHLLVVAPQLIWRLALRAD